ncbi:hypothetical protein [Pedobacter sp. R-06]|uniref:hypothetical protein n=1 Tax=Pedobacter sp. R-06 TaxID=3404051 RepID=UPI003CF3D6C6
MKKLKLNESKFAGAEILSRSALKKVIGGAGTIIDANCDNECASDWDCAVSTEGGRCVTYADEKCGYISICQ